MKKSETVEKILMSFYTLIAEKGYDAASMNDVSKHAGVSKGAIYHHFSGKEELFIKVLDFVFSGMIDQFDLNPSNFTKENYKDELKKMGIDFLRESKENKEFKKFQNEFFAQATRNAKVKDYLQTALNSYRSVFFNLFTHLKDQGVEFKDEIELISTKIFVILDALMLYETFKVDLNFEKLWESFLDDIFI